MTEQNHEAIAQIIKRAMLNAEWDNPEIRNAKRRVTRNIADELSMYLYAEGPRFDIERFLSACGCERNG